MHFSLSEYKFVYLSLEYHAIVFSHGLTDLCIFAQRIMGSHYLACRSRQASIVLERYFRFEVSLLSTLCMRMEMGTSRVSGDSDIIT